MKQSIFGMVLILAVLAVIIPSLLQGNEQPVAQPELPMTVSKDDRPACPQPTVAGVSLPCLGASSKNSPSAPTLVTVWAWWCGPCKEEMPLFAQFAAEHPEWNVVGVHADSNAEAGVAKLNDWNINLPSYQDSTGEFAAALSLPNVVPVTLVLSPDGVEVARFTRTFASLEELNDSVAQATR